MVRTRFAPSPTGYMHVGGLRTALYSYLLARSKQGEFLLRIDDTDRTRYVEGAVEGIIETLNQFGLTYDKGPLVQSERTERYRQAAEELLENNMAYRCFCTSSDLAKMREDQEQAGQPPQYDKRCRYLDTDGIAKRVDDGDDFVIRLKVPETGGVTWKDGVRGKVSYSYSSVDDQVLLKSDGFPTYHLANVVDDHDYGITHVVRGEEWLPSTPKHLFLYEAFGWDDVPVFAHLSILVNEDRKKLSKRDGDFSVHALLEQGYTVEGLLNYIALLGWNPKTTDEIFSLADLEEMFTMDGVNKAAAVYDEKRLRWFNGQWIRKMSPERFREVVDGFLPGAYRDLSEEQLSAALALEQGRIELLTEVGAETDFFVAGIDGNEPAISYDAELLVWRKGTPEGAADALRVAREVLNGLSDFDAKGLEKALFEVINDESNQFGPGDMLWPLRVALTGKERSPGPFDSAALLGRERSLARIDFALEKLGG